jgi:sulfate-transporting ATPase
MLLGLGAGAAYAITAMGIVVIYRGSRVINFAQTGLASVGAYTFYGLHRVGVVLPVAAVLGVCAAALAGAAVYVLVLRPLSHATDLIRLVSVLGAYLVIENATILIAGNNVLLAPAVLPGSYLHIGSLSFPLSNVYLLAIAVTLAAVLVAVMRWTSFGFYTRAVGENDVIVRGLGHSADQISIANWMLGGALAGLAGILLASTLGLTTVELETLLLPALAAALAARFTSFPVALVTGLLIGVLESEFNNYLPRAGLEDSFALIVIIVALLKRGRSLPTREEVMARLPAVGDGRMRLAFVLPVVVAACVAVDLIPDSWQTAVATSAAAGLIFVSIVVITGYAGQISLGQFAIAGVAALAAGELSGGLGLPILLVIPVVILGVIPVGLAVGVPAFGARGMNLAISTLALGFVINEALLNNPAVTGQSNGITTRSPEFFGYSIDALVHPNRYAVLSVIVLALGCLAVAQMRRSFIARRWLAVRANERAASAIGINVQASKASALCVAAMLAAAGGMLFAFSGPMVNFSGYSTDVSINAIVLIAIGGIGYISGAINGSLIATAGLLTYLITEYTGLNYDLVGLIAGAVVVVNVIVAPSGVISLNIQQFRSRWPVRDRPSDFELVPDVQAGTTPDRSGLKLADVEQCLSVEHISVRFGGIAALEAVTMTLAQGEIVGMIGPNGAGKTTFIDVVSGLTRHDEGSVSLGNSTLDGADPSRRAKAGLARTFQGVELFDDMTLADNIRAAAECHKSTLAWWKGALDRGGGIQAPPVCLDALQSFGLGKELKRFPTELPYGKRSLVGVCRALATNPKYLLLDEPAAGLSASERASLTEFLRRAAREYGIGILLIEHDVALVLSLCERVIAMDFGRVIASGTPEEIRHDPGVVESYLGVTVDDPK